MPNYRDNEARDAEGDNGGGEQSDDICRDFLRNNCSRGNRCRYRHPNDADNGSGNGGRQSGGDLEFCHDFQNAGCRRVNCRFVHCSRDEEDHYKRTGQIPSSVDGPRNRGSRFDDLPICKDYLKGDCHRGNRCKYRHVSQREIDMEDMQRERMMMQDRGGPFDGPFPGGPMPPRLGSFDDDLVVGAKRRFMDGGQFGGVMSDRRLINPEEVQMLQDENAMLRQKVDQLRKQVADLTATNETLLEQNARFRSGVRAPAGPVLAPGPAPALNGGSDLMAQRQGGSLGGYGEPPSLLGSGQLQMGGSSMGPGAFGMQRNPGLLGGPRPGLVSYPLMAQNARMG